VVGSISRRIESWQIGIFATGVAITTKANGNQTAGDAKWQRFEGVKEPSFETGSFKGTTDAVEQREEKVVEGRINLKMRWGIRMEMEMGQLLVVCLILGKCLPGVRRG
jgi:hypothetical protein